MTWHALAWAATASPLALHPIRAWLVGALVVVGTAFLLAGTVGILRFDTVYNRMHAVSKPTSVGAVAIFLAAFVRFGPGGAGMPSLVGIAFLFLTVPAGTHLIARAAERMGVPFREGVTWPDPPGGDPTSGEAGRERPEAADDREPDGEVGETGGEGEDSEGEGEDSEGEGEDSEGEGADRDAGVEDEDPDGEAADPEGQDEDPGSEDGNPDREDGL